MATRTRKRAVSRDLPSTSGRKRVRWSARTQNCPSLYRDLLELVLQWQEFSLETQMRFQAALETYLEHDVAWRGM